VCGASPSARLAPVAVLSPCDDTHAQLCCSHPINTGLLGRKPSQRPHNPSSSPSEPRRTFGTLGTSCSSDSGEHVLIS
jgi:hypothetical protein